MIQKIRFHWPGILLMVLTLVVGLLSYKDYGVNWDDPDQRDLGYINYNYIAKNDTTLRGYAFKEYGPAFELLLVFAEKQMKAPDTRDIFLMRHLINHIFFLTGACFFYLLAYRLFKKRSLACLCLLMIILAPRIYTHSFFNTKDIPFFAAISISLYFCTRAFQKGRPLLFIIAGICCGFASSIRIMGVMLLVYVSFFLLIELISAIVKKENSNKPLKNLLSFCGAFCLTLYVCFPYLWPHPLSNFLDCFTIMSHYTWDGTIFQNGKFIHSNNIPWYVFIVWFVITNPVIWLLLGFGGIIYFCFDFLKKPLDYFINTEKKIFLLYFLCFITPIAAVISLHSVIYEDWRHLFFVYPPFLLMAVYFVNKIYYSKIKLAVLSLILLQVVVTGYTMIRTFPLNQVYFNPLVSHRSEYLRSNYEMDYWGVGFKQGLDNILSKDKSESIVISTDVSGMVPLANNIMLLTPEDRKRVQLVEANKPFDYFLTDFRCHPEDYGYPGRDYSIRAFNSTVIGIYRLKP